MQGEGLGEFYDIDKLTMFADYRVPVVLRELGILDYSPALAEKVQIETPNCSRDESWVMTSTCCSPNMLQMTAHCFCTASSPREQASCFILILLFIGFQEAERNAQILLKELAFDCDKDACCGLIWTALRASVLREIFVTLWLNRTGTGWR